MGSRKGYRTTEELLAGNRNREEELAAQIEVLANGQSDPEVGELLRDIARRCRKNSEKIAQLIETLSSPEYEVKLKCPVCGWAIPYGKNPEPGAEVKCELCSIWFKLLEKEGDYILENIGRRDA